MGYGFNKGKRERGIGFKWLQEKVQEWDENNKIQERVDRGMECRCAEVDGKQVDGIQGDMAEKWRHQAGVEEEESKFILL